MLSVIWGLSWGLKGPRLTPISWIHLRDAIEIVVPALLVGILFFLKKNDAIYTVNIADFLRYFIFIIFAFLSIIIIYFFTVIIFMGLSDANIF